MENTSDKTSVHLRCIFCVVELLSVCITVSNITCYTRIHIFSRDAERKNIYFSTPVPETKLTFVVPFYSKKCIILQ
jgi:hypothetical protein